MKVLFAHPTGNQNVRAAVAGLLDAGILHSFKTTISIFPGDVLDRLSHTSAFALLGRRRFDRRLREFTDNFPWREAGRLAALRCGLSQLVRHETGLFCLDSVYRSFDKHVATTMAHRASQDISALYAYEDGALWSFRRAQQLGLARFYDLPVGYWREGQKIMQEEKERWPAWASTLTGLHDSRDKLARKDEEIGLATKIFVASEFTATTLRSYPGILPPVQVIPYGFPPVGQVSPSPKDPHGPLKLLFVGGLTQRKGIAYLFDAVKKLKRYISLTVVGRKTTQTCPALDLALADHRWIPGLPHHEILKVMRNHDVLVFPSLFEGFGLVITEAMSQGTPVITTERTVGPDLIDHGNNGWIIEAGSSESLSAVLEQILERRKMAYEAGYAAMETARLRPWSMYAKELADAITDTPVGEKVKNADHERVSV